MNNVIFIEKHAQMLETLIEQNVLTITIDGPIRTVFLLAITAIIAIHQIRRECHVIITVKYAQMWVIINVANVNLGSLCSWMESLAIPLASQSAIMPTQLLIDVNNVINIVTYAQAQHKTSAQNVLLDIIFSHYPQSANQHVRETTMKMV